MSEQLAPDLAVRLLRAKAGEQIHAAAQTLAQHDGLGVIDDVRADLAMIALLLADEIERRS